MDRKPKSRSAELRQRLLQLRREAKERLDTAMAVVASESEDSVSRHVSATNAEAATDTINAINEALQKLRHRQYGRCKSCGEAISVKRLKVVPFALRCCECQRKLETPRYRPVRMFGDEHLQIA